MRRSAFRCLGTAFLLGLGFLAAAAPSLAAGEDPLRKSLASKLLQSRAQLRIYRHDDQTDLKCGSRAFVNAEVVSRPRVVDEVLDERKWLERWVLDRCGAEVPYHVFFTVVGNGGAFFVFEEID